jgi:hypothetical protein
MSNTDLNAQAKAQWGKFRLFIAAHPLTGFWCGVGAGVIFGGLVRGIL